MDILTLKSLSKHWFLTTSDAQALLVFHAQPLKCEVKSRKTIVQNFCYNTDTSVFLFQFSFVFTLFYMIHALFEVLLLVTTTQPAVQGCIFRLTCSFPELTEDHVLTSAYVKFFRIVTRNDVNKSV